MSLTQIASFLFGVSIIIIFITTSGFNTVIEENDKEFNIQSSNNFHSSIDNRCHLSVESGDNAEFCGAGEVTLNASVSGVSLCVDCT